jgi:hypothetical protein
MSSQQSAKEFREEHTKLIPVHKLAESAIPLYGPPGPNGKLRCALRIDGVPEGSCMVLEGSIPYAWGDSGKRTYFEFTFYRMKRETVRKLIRWLKEHYNLPNE